MSSSRHLSFKAFCYASLFALLPQSNADITLTGVPTSACVGANAAGTASFSSNLAVSTGNVQLAAGDYWNQAGAVWEFSTDTKGFAFSQPGIPGYGAGVTDSIPEAAEDAFKLSDDKSTITFAVPSPTLGGSWEVLWEAEDASAANTPTTSSQAPSPTWSAGACSVS